MRRGIFIIDKNSLLEDIRRNSDILEDLTGYPKKRIEQDKSRRFRKELEDKIEKRIRILKKLGYLDKANRLTEKAIKKYSSKIIGEMEKEIMGHYEYGKYLSNKYGVDESWYSKKYGIGDKYSEINPKLSIRKSLRCKRDIFVVEKKKERKGGNYIILLDASGSMYGEKIYEAKKAILVLLNKIRENNDRVSLIVFNDKILVEHSEIENIEDILKDIFEIFPNGSTDIALALSRAIKFVKGKDHIVLITDALPTHGRKPLENTLHMVKELRNMGCTISVIGIKLNKEGEEIAKKIIKIGNGKLFVAKDIKDIAKFVLIDYINSKMK